MKRKEEEMKKLHGSGDGAPSDAEKALLA